MPQDLPHGQNQHQPSTGSALNPTPEAQHRDFQRFRKAQKEKRFEKHSYKQTFAM